MIEDMHMAAGMSPGKTENFASHVGAPADLRLTDKEMNALRLLKELHVALADLPAQHPYEHQSYAMHVHEIKAAIALRQARRMDPTIWPTFKKGENGRWEQDHGDLPL
jgi:hypothetical protein